MRLVLSEQFLLSLPKSGSARLSSCVQKTRDYVRDVVREGQETGVLRADVDASALAVVVMGTVQMLAISTSSHGHGATGARAVRDGLMALLQPVAPTRSKNRKRSA